MYMNVQFMGCPNRCGGQLQELPQRAADGSAIGVCTNCGTRCVAHSCALGLGAAWLLPIAGTLITSECPTCRVVYNLTNVLATAPDLPVWLKQVLPLVQVAALLVGAVVLVQSLTAARRPGLLRA